MAAQSKKVTFQIGMMVVPMRLEKATDHESSDTKTVCAGTDEKPHPPALVKQSMTCSYTDADGKACGIKHSSHYPFPRGVPQGDGFVVVTGEDLARAAGAPIKEVATMNLHSRAEVFGATVAADSVQNVSPDKGGEPAYQVLLQGLTKNPELVFATVWAPSTKNALWVLEAVDSRLVVSKRCWPEDVRTPPAIAPIEVPQMHHDMMAQYLEQAVTPFKVADYRDAARQGRAALIAERSGEAQPLATSDVAAPAASGDVLAGLKATVDALNKAKKPVKRVAKKAPAKKATPRKRAPRKPAEPAA